MSKGRGPSAPMVSSPTPTVEGPSTSNAPRDMAFQAESEGFAPGAAPDRPTPTLDAVAAHEAGQAAPASPSTPNGTVGGTGALVLSRDPAYATRGFLTWFRTQIDALFAPWGLAFDGTRVRLEGTGASAAVVLDWSPTWGQAPITREMTVNRWQPIEARAAVAGMQALPGWASVSAADQRALAGLVGGETNAVSVAARRHLRTQWATITGQDATGQAQALAAVIGNPATRPSLSDETVRTSAIAYTLAGPVAEQGHAFVGQSADADVYTATYGDGVTVKIFAPRAPLDPGMHQHTVAQAAEAAAAIAPAARAVLRTITLNPVVNPDDAHWAAVYNTPDFHSYMTAGAAGDVTVYPSTAPRPDTEYMKGTMLHETGHTWSFRQWGNDTSGSGWQPWRAAMSRDRSSVSQYADNDIAEDVAETISIYAAIWNTPTYLEYKAIIPNRLAILEAQMPL